jgi:hypothetical protein
VILGHLHGEVCMISTVTNPYVHIYIPVRFRSGTTKGMDGLFGVEGWHEGFALREDEGLVDKNKKR